MKKLILFVHGLGGSEETWGEFPKLIKEDSNFNNFDVKLFTYKTSLMRIKSVASLSSKIISSIFPLSIISKIASVFSIAVPQHRLPKIQHVADLLKTDIEEYYSKYDELYFITHSMGGLVARKYLHDMIKSENSLQVKKLMLYAVPNNGSKWAKLISLYSHEQIEQLDGDSDFLELLNNEIAHIDLDKHLEILYIIGTEDEVVSMSSAKSCHRNKNTKFLPNGHIDIVKPISADDRSYVVFKNFISDAQEAKPIESKESIQDVKNNPFITKVYQSLESEKLLTLFSQDFTDISTQQALVKQKMEYVFQDGFYHLSIPQSLDDESEYFKYLAEDCGFSKTINRVHLWRKKVAKKLKNSSNQKTCFYITNIEDGNIKLNLEFAKAIRSLQGEFSNFYVIFVGRKKLASLVYGKDSKLSPLNTAEWIFFDDSKESISLDKIKQEFIKLKSDGETLCMYLDDEAEIEWEYYSESILNTLFWRNIMQNQNNKYVWRDEATKQIAKEIFGV